MDAIHISAARRMLDQGKPVTLRYITSKGRLVEAEQVVSLRFDIYGGTRTIKHLRSGEKRTVRDVCIVGINDFEVYI